MDLPPPPTTLPPSFGAAVIALIAASFLGGCLLVQIYVYFKSGTSMNHSMVLKGLVWGIVFVDTVHLVATACYVYGSLVLHFGDVLYITKAGWPFFVYTGLSVFTSTPVQLFYAWRVYILSGRKPMIPLIVCGLSTLAFGFGLASTILAIKEVFFVRYSSFEWVVDTWLSANILGDLIIVSSLCYYLGRSRSGFKQSDQIIDKLVFVVINTGLAPTFMEFGHLLSFSIAPNNLAHLAFNILAPKLYANSLLASLNARTFFMMGNSFNDTHNGSTAVGSSHYMDHDRNKFEMHSFGTRSGVQPGRSKVLDIKVTTEYDQESNGPSGETVMVGRSKPLPEI